MAVLGRLASWPRVAADGAEGATAAIRLLCVFLTGGERPTARQCWHAPENSAGIARAIVFRAFAGPCRDC